MTKTVTSKDNPVLKSARKLLTRKGREEAGAFLLEGRKLIEEAISAGFDIECVFVDAGARLRGETAEEWPNEIVLEEKLFHTLAQTVTPQPCIAVARRRDMNPADPACVLILDRIGDPGNVGTMIRTALASGMNEVWCVKGTADVFSDKAIRASAGAILHLPVREGLSAMDCISSVRSMGAMLVVCEAGGKNLYEARLENRIAIVIGSEGAGPQPEFVSAADAVVGIPMTETSESLNAATAAAIVMYEALRRRTSPGDQCT